MHTYGLAHVSHCWVGPLHISRHTLAGVGAVGVVAGLTALAIDTALIDVYRVVLK